MLQIRLLGQFDIRLDGQRVTISSRAGQSLLAYLALTASTPHRRKKLAGIFWPDTSDENTRKNLRQELWRIRKALTRPNKSPTICSLMNSRSPSIEKQITGSTLPKWKDPIWILNPSHPIFHSIRMNYYPGFFDDWVVLERERIQTILKPKWNNCSASLSPRSGGSLSRNRANAGSPWGIRLSLPIARSCLPTERVEISQK